MQSTAFMVLLAFAATAWSQDCTNDFTNFAQCVKGEIQSKLQDPATAQNIRNDINQCFTEQNCPVPDYNAQPEESGIGKAVREFHDSLSDEQKQCLKREIKAKMEEKLEECLGGPIPQDFKNALQSVKPEEGLTQQQKNAIKDMKRQKRVVKQAAKSCAESNQGANKEALKECMRRIKRKGEGMKCQLADQCDSEISSSACQTKFDDTRDELCRCAKEAKEKAEAEFEAKQQEIQNAGPGGLLARFQNRGNSQREGKFTEIMDVCNIDTSAFRQKMQAAVQEELGCSGITCLAKLAGKGSQGQMKKAMQEVREMLGGGKGVPFCDCDGQANNSDDSDEF